MAHAMLSAFAKRGAVFHMQYMRFPGDPNTHNKFFVLLEDDWDALETIYIAITTSSTKYKNQPTAVFLPINSEDFFLEDTVIDVTNLQEIDHDVILKPSVSYIGQLSEKFIEEIDDAIENHSYLEDKVYYRIARG